MDSYVWSYLFIGIIVLALVVYKWTKKLYNIMYALSGIAQVITVAYVIWAFRLGSNAILLVLVLAAVFMMGEGFLLGKTFKKKK